MSSVCRRSPLEALAPIRITEIVFSYFSPKDITCRLALVCRDFARHSADERIWQRQALRQLDKRTAGEWFVLMKRNWKKTCLVRIRVYRGIIEEGIFKKFRKIEERALPVNNEKTIIQTNSKIEMKLNGLGQRIYSDGRVEQGIFSMGYLAQGIIFHPDEVLYEGSFLAGHLHGLGKKTFRGKTIEKGIFQGDRLHGEGMRVHLSDGSIEKGEFENGWLNGPGMIIWPNGAKEQGTFYKGRLMAKRQIILPDGTIVEGTIGINGLLSGPGKVTSPNGRVTKIDFQSDSVIG